jgi:hypothetical protein
MQGRITDEAPAIVDLDRHLMPVAVRHVELGLSKSVLEVLEDWTTPAFTRTAGRC